MLTFRLHRTTTGAPLSIPVRARGRSNMSMTAVGNGTHALPLAGTQYSPDQWQDATGYWWNTLAVCWNDWPIYAGLIRKTRWSKRSKVLTLETVTVDALLDDRLAFGVSAFAEGDFEVVAKSLRSALAQIIRHVSTEGPFPSPRHSRALPFLFSHENEAGAFAKLWEAKDWKTAADMIRFVRELDGGPDLAFIPVYDAARNLRWEVRAGNPRIDGVTIDLPVSVRKSPAIDVDYIGDGSGMLTGLFLPGEGGGSDRVFGEAGDFDIGDVPRQRPLMPIRDAVRSKASTLDKTVLDSNAEAQLKRDRFPTNQIELAIVGKSRELTLGTRLNVRDSGDEYTKPFNSLQYVVALSHDTNRPHVLSPEVQAL